MKAAWTRSLPELVIAGCNPGAPPSVVDVVVIGVMAATRTSVGGWLLKNCREMPVGRAAGVWMEFLRRCRCVISFDHNHYAGWCWAPERAMVWLGYPTLVPWVYGRVHGILTIDTLGRNGRWAESERARLWDG